MTYDDEQVLVQRVMEAFALKRCGVPLEAVAGLTKAAYRDYAEIAVETIREAFDER